MPVRTRPPLGFQSIANDPVVVDSGGSSDSTGNIQAAVDQAYAQGRAVYLPAGTYILTSKIKLYTGVRMYGDGYQSVLQASASFDTNDPENAGISPMVEAYHQTVPGELIHYYTEMDHLRLIGLPAEADLFGWHGMYQTYGNHVHHCWFQDFGGSLGAIDPSNSYKNIIESNVLTDCTYGITLTGTNNQFGNLITHNQLFACTNAIGGNFPYDTVISHNVIHGAHNGININGSYNSIGGVIIHGNVVRVIDVGAFSAVALYIGTGSGSSFCTNFTITDNFFASESGISTDIITLYRLHRSRVAGNVIDCGASLNGIAIRGASTGVIIEDNDFISAHYDIDLASGSNNSNNTIRHNRFGGDTNTIRLQAGTNTLIQGNDSSGAVGSFSDAGTGTINEMLQVTAAGTAYSLTNTAAALDFGTTDPAVTLSRAGRWKLEAQVQLDYAGATVVAETATIKLRRTNNTAADVTGATATLDLPISTTLTNTYGIFRLPPVYYTATAGDIIALFGNVSATLGAGTIDAVAAGIIATPCF